MKRVLLATVIILAGSTSALADARQSCNEKKGEAAIRGCTELIRSNPTDATGYYNRGMANYDKEDIDRALADYNKAIEIDPKHPEAYNDRALAYQYKGDLERAIADYNKAIEIDPRHADAYNNRGNAYGAKGELDRAIADHIKAIELDPEDADYLRALGVARFGKGDYNGAAVDLLRAVELEDDAYAMLFRYLARARAGETPAAELEANAGRLETKKWPYAVTELYLGKRSPVATLDAAVNAHDRCEAQFYIGEWHLLKGTVASARTAFQAVANACPKTFIEYEVAVAELKRLKP